MKRLISLLSMIAVLATSALAHDFEVDGIYYVKNSDGNSVSVSYKGTSSDQYSNEYSGAVNIPPSVTYSGKTYDVTSIGSSAFSHCVGMESVTIPNSVTSVGTSAFQYCSFLTKVEISDLAAWCGISFGNASSNPLYSANHLFYLNGNEIKDLIIPNTVKTIGSYAFEGCSGLMSVTIPNSVTSIGQNAFQNCGGLTSVTIPNSVTSIGGHAFSGCSGLTSITIPNSVKTISYYAFQNCSGLTSVTIGNSVASIGQNAFQNCSGLTSVTLPHSVTGVGQYAFQNCSGLASLTIGKSVSSIGSYAFDGCTSLTLVTDYSPTPQSVNAYVFNNLSLSNIDLKVPAGCSAAYRAVAPWKYFKSIEEILPLFFSPTSGEYEESVTVLITAAVGSEIRYTLDGTEPASTSTLYTEPIVLNEIGSTTVIKAIAIKDGIISDIETATYTIKLAAPTITPSGGTYNAPVTVSMSAPQGSDIYFTTDGTDPSEQSLKYTEPFVVNGACTIKAIAVSNNFTSAIISRSYVIDIYTPPIIIPTTGVDPTSYPKKNGLTVTNLWLHSLNGDEREGAQYWANLPFANSNYCRTSLIYGNKVYVAESRPTVVEEGGEPKTYCYATLHEFDLVSGNFIKSTTLTNDGSPIVSPSPLCFNQIGVDNYGNVWGCGYTSNCHNAPLRPYVINLEDGTVTYVGECQVPDTEETAGGRVDYLDVVGDITGAEADGILMTAPSNTDNIYAYRWRRAQGTDEWVGGFTDHKVAKALNGTYPTGLSKWGGATVLKIVESTSNSAEEFYIDDFLSNPVRYNVSGTAVDGFQNCTELAPTVGCNGFEYFTIANHNMLAWVYNQYDRSYDVNIAPAGGCVIKVGELGSNSQFSDLHEYWTLPKEGLGMTSDGGNRIHSISTQKVTDRNGKEGVLLLTHKCRNGLGVYLVAEDGFDVSNIIPYPEPDAPTFSPESGEYEEYVDVTISAEEDAEIRYTLDGTDPNENSALYTNPISFYEIGSTNVVKAVAIKHGLLSDVATATYTIIEASEPSSANLKVIMEMTNKENLVTSSDGRFSTGYGDYIYINDKANGIVVRYDKAGARSDYAEVAGIGTGITSDDVGNILVNKGFGTASSAVNWVIIEPDGTQHELTLTYPDAVAAARVDVAGRVVGDMMSNIGAYLFLAVSNASKIVAFKIAEGKQDGDAFESPTAQYAFDATTFAQPRYATVDEIDAAIDPSTAVVYRKRGNVNVYGWNEEGTEIVDFGKPEGASTCEGFDIFKIGDIYYSVEPSTDASYADGFAIRELGKTENIVTKDKVLYAGGSQRFQSLTARVFDNTYAIIYQNVSGEGIGMYKFTPAGTGVNTIAAEGKVVATAYYNLQGVRVNNPAAGQILIKVNTLSNGKVSASKVVVK